MPSIHPNPGCKGLAKATRYQALETGNARSCRLVQSLRLRKSQGPSVRCICKLTSTSTNVTTLLCDALSLYPDPAPPVLPSLSQMLHTPMPRSESRDSTQNQPKGHCLRSSFGPLVHIDTFLVCGELGNHRSVKVGQLEKDTCSKSCGADERSALKL
jgi:hypothetical protein